jgi:putative heme-binding domain-containing protein
LTSVINPNAEIREGFENVNLLTVDGRTLSGFVTDEDTQIITMRGKAGEDIRVERNDVEELAPVGISLMPENLLQDLNDQQLLDLFAYLRISQPISP